MPRKIPRRSRPRRYRRRRFPKKSHVPRNLSTHRFTRNARNSTIDLSQSIPYPNWYPRNFVFALDAVINVSDFKNLFDQFKITGISIKLRWSPLATTYSSDNTWVGTGAYNPVLYYFTDHTDTNFVASLDDMLEIQKHRSVRLVPGKPVYITVKPAVLAQAYKTALSTAYGPKWGMKLNMDDSATPHYGLKMGVSKIDNDLGSIQAEIKYHFTCYGVQ